MKKAAEAEARAEKVEAENSTLVQIVEDQAKAIADHGEADKERAKSEKATMKILEAVISSKLKKASPAYTFDDPDDDMDD
jgi:hypothetical protein